MKNKLFAKLGFVFLFSTTVAFAQNKDLRKNEDVKTDKSLIVKSDSIQIIEAKKKAAAEEKANFPKPYHPEENAKLKLQN